MFSWQCNIHEMAPFGRFLGPFSCKYDSSLLKFQPKVCLHNTKRVSEQSFNITYLSRNETYPKLTVLVHFWAQFPPERNQNIAKNQNFFQKLPPYNYQITQSQVPEKSQNSYKMNFKKKFGGPNMDFLR